MIDKDPKAAPPTDPGAPVTVSVYLKPRAEPPPTRALGPPLTREEFAAAYGADPADVDAVKRFAADHGLTVATVDAGRSLVQLTGTPDQLQRAFQVQLVERHADGQTFQEPSGPVVLPPQLQDRVTGVFGLSTRPVAVPHPQGN